MGFDGSSITGFNAIEESDMVAIPDPETFQLMPWKEGETRVARMICDVVTPDGNPYDGDPRYVLRRALERMRSMGFDTFNVGPELEYFLFSDDKGTETLDEGGYFAMTTLDAASELRQETVRALEGMGIPIEYVHHEVGPSQHEIDMRFAPALEMADHTHDLPARRQGGREEGRLPRDLHAEADLRRERLRDAHAQSLFTDGRNAFFDERDQWHLSDVGQGVHRRPAPPRARDRGGLRPVGELVQAARARLRGAGLRRLVAAQPLGADPDPALQAGPEQATRAEIRCPDPACNPYLTFAALLHAGLEGIEQGYELPDPMETNLYHLTAEQRRERGIVSLPGDARRGDRRARAAPTLVRTALGPHIFDRYVELKRKEWDEYRVQLTDVGDGALPARALRRQHWARVRACEKSRIRRLRPRHLRPAGPTDGRLRAALGQPASRRSDLVRDRPPRR